jgi:hypothetical protein
VKDGKDTEDGALTEGETDLTDEELGDVDAAEGVEDGEDAVDTPTPAAQPESSPAANTQATNPINAVLIHIMIPLAPVGEWRTAPGQPPRHFAQRSAGLGSYAAGDGRALYISRRRGTFPGW